MKNKLTDNVSFDFIRYANCWEDADILLEGLKPKAGEKILSIGSAGDNSFSLLTCDPEIVVAVDVNKIQLHLIELKKICIIALEYNELLAFLGFRASSNRVETFNILKSKLSEDARLYWEHHIAQIEKGVISEGKFEHYFQLFSQKILPWIHNKRTTEALLKPKSAAEQADFYHKNWNTWRWRLLFKIFFSRYVMGKYGRDPEFLKQVKIPVGEFIFQKAAHHLQSVGAQQNFMLRYNLTGNFGDLLPHYLQPENLQKVKANIHKLHIVEGYAEAAIQDFGPFHCMNLSNIFEYMDSNLFEATANQLLEGTMPNGRLAYWNLMVPRQISERFPTKATYQNSSKTLSEIDKGFFYNQFIVDLKMV